VDKMSNENSFKENNKGLVQPPASSFSTTEINDQWFLDYADYHRRIQEKFKLSCGNAFDVFEEIQDKGLFDDCHSLEECEAVIDKYELAGDWGQDEFWFLASEMYAYKMVEKLKITGGNISYMFDRIKSKGLFDDCCSVEDCENVIENYTLTDKERATVDAKPKKPKPVVLDKDWYLEFESLR